MPTYSLYPVTGIFGGVGLQGNIDVNFFYEKRPIPESTTHEVLENGLLGEEISRKSCDSVIREVMFGVSISHSNARLFAKWLNDRADEIEKIFIQSEGSKNV